MVCVYCGGKTEVFNSRWQKRNNQVWRRRRCQQCGAVFTTHEGVEFSSSLSVKRGASREPFVPERLYMEVLLSIQDRKDCYSEAKELTAQVVRNLLKTSQKASFTPTDITAATAQTLKRFSRRAWLRYISEHPSVQD